jgi:hypothetical protein
VKHCGTCRYPLQVFLRGRLSTSTASSSSNSRQLGSVVSPYQLGGRKELHLRWIQDCRHRTAVRQQIRTSAVQAAEAQTIAGIDEGQEAAA